jgi:tetratricopeptide (TPR) repeat protein
MSDRSEQAKSIFLEAMEKQGPDQWPAFLGQACGGDTALRAEVEKLLRARSELGSFHEAPRLAPTLTVDQPLAEIPGTRIGPYKLLQEIGEGGMGTVWMAEQQEPVRRLVALKVIKAGMDSAQVIARFEAERQALALMDHPNIATVLDAGTTVPIADLRLQIADLKSEISNLQSAISPGRPFFVMELVKGIPITKYCDEHRLTPRQRLELFVPVCQAIQHAHQKGIIHRDVKPSNVLVAPYDGKPVVKVIDFGVAKATGQRLTERTLFTGFGAVVGTLEYMSPEQAELNNQDIDTRSDIYSLGVLLYELLTGTTPLTKERMKEAAFMEMLRIIREDEPPKPSTRLSSSKTLLTIAAARHTEPAKLTKLVRGELDWIVMKALEKDRGRRYETANGLARDVERYLVDEPVQACPPSAWYRLRKFARRNRAGLRIAAAAALVLLLAVGGVSWALWDQATRRTELSERMAETEKTVSAALIRTDQWRKLAGEARSATSQEADAALALWRLAEASLEPAETALRTGTADDHLRQRVLDVRQQIEQHRAQAQRTAKLLRDLDEARMTAAIWISTHFDSAGAAAKYAAAFTAYGLEVKPGRTAELAQRIRAEQPAIREALIVALDYWSNSANVAKTAEANLVRALAAAGDDDPWRRKHRAAATARGDGPEDSRRFGDATTLLALSGEARHLSLPPSSLQLLAMRLDWLGERGEALALLRWARGRHLTDFWIHFDLGTLLDEDKSPVILEEAIGCYRAALALRPDSSAAHNNLGTCFFYRRQLDEAVLCYSKAIELDPKHVFALTNRGRAYIDLKQSDKALADLSKAIDVDPDYADAHFFLGKLLHAKNQLDQAIGEYRTAIRLDPKFARAHNDLGNLLHIKNKVDEAIAEYHTAIRLDPKLATPHNDLGMVLAEKKQWKEASAEFRKAIHLAAKYALPHYNLGRVLYDQKLFDEASAEFRKAIDLGLQNAPIHNSLGLALQKNNQLDEAIAEFRKAIALNPKHPKNATVHSNLSTVLVAKNELDEAIVECKKAIELDPKFAPAHYGLGNALQGKNQLDDAIAAYKKAIEFNPKYAEAYNNLGLVLLAKDRLDDAIAAYRKAIEFDPKCAPAHYNLGKALKAKNQLDEASAEYKKAIDLQPDYAEAHCNLAFILRLQGKLSASLEFYQRGHALGSKRKDWGHPSAQWVADAERLVRLEAKLADVLAGKATPTDNRELLGLLNVCRLQRRHVAAARLYADAFSADPKLADDLKGWHRYNAACYSAMAAAGQGTDADKLDDKERTRLRQQALAWLRSDLEAWSKRLAGGKPEDRQEVQAKLEHWQRDTDLAGVRDADALKNLSAEERETWAKLWADVAQLLKKAGNAK